MKLHVKATIEMTYDIEIDDELYNAAYYSAGTCNCDEDVATIEAIEAVDRLITIPTASIIDTINDNIDCYTGAELINLEWSDKP